MVCTTLYTVCVILCILFIYTLLFRKMFHLITDTLIITLIISNCIGWTHGQMFIDDMNYNGNVEIVINATDPFNVESLCIYFPNAVVGSQGPGQTNGHLNDGNYAQTIATLFETKGFPKGSVTLKTYVKASDFISSVEMTCSYNIVIIPDDPNKSEEIEQIAEWILNVWRCDDMDLTIYTYEQTGIDNLWAAFGDDCDISVCPLDTTMRGIGCLPASTETYEVLSNDTQVSLINVVDNVKHRIQMNTGRCKLKNCVKGEERLNTAIVRISKSSSFDNSLSPLSNGQTTRSFKINAKKWWTIFYTIIDYINTIVQTMTPRHRAVYPEGWMLRYA
nr:viral structural protein 7 [Rotavirus C]QUD20881.1 viral structural protein 7 [Rotavirus C]QUD20883.1 viral structural protein 7 [Rotavirus C]QUD20885.1 viral structural protein 7 [Rotavirus C]QUD20887.1 viral structural protein 7 [Rotavirus C]